MRKLLISVLIALLLLITIYSVVKGLSIGNIKILGFNDIKTESGKLETGIDDITKLKEQTYKKTLSDIESNAKTLIQEKEDYARAVSTSTSSEIEKATHNEKYEQDFLWAKIGNHATSQGVKLKFDIAVGSVNKNNYDLHFTATGTYANITEFVMALENDNLLNFKIENFKLVPVQANTNKNTTGNTTTNTNKDTNKNANSNTSNTTIEEEVVEELKLQATFKVTDIAINIDKTKINQPVKEESVQNKQTNTTGTNTTATNTAVKNEANVNTTTEGTTAE